jgi:hypothetical protein
VTHVALPIRLKPMHELGTARRKLIWATFETARR